jgi:hypothetical protein
VVETVLRCEKCFQLGTRPVVRKEANRFDRPVRLLPEFRPDARDVFGWSLRDSLPKKRDQERL